MTRTEFSFDSIVSDARSIPVRNISSKDRLTMNSEIVSMFPANDPAGVLIDLTDTIVTTVDDIAAPEMTSSTSAEDSADLRNAAERIWRRCLDAIRPQLSAQTMR